MPSWNHGLTFFNPFKVLSLVPKINAYEYISLDIASPKKKYVRGVSVTEVGMWMKRTFSGVSRGKVLHETWVSPEK